MIKREIVITAIISLLVGLAAGSYVASRYWLNFNAQFVLQGEFTRVEAGITTKIAVLNRIRGKNDKEAIKILEMLLDDDFMTAGTLVKEGHALNPKVISAVASEIRERKVSGYEPTDPNTRAFVQDMINILIKGTYSNGAQQGAPVVAQKAARP